MTSHFSSKGKQETSMAPTIEKAVTPLKFPNKEELETDFSPTSKEDGIKEEPVARSDPKEFIVKTSQC